VSQITGNNTLTGAIPTELGGLLSLTSLDLGKIANVLIAIALLEVFGYY
jgi:hypothetical protein